MNYNKFRYIYPCRPKNAAPISDIDKYDNNSMICQPKFNGSNISIYTNGDECLIYNRHNDKLTNCNLEIAEIHENIFKCEKGNWILINGEYLNKSKYDENNTIFNHKLIIFDILVFESKHLIGKTFQDRVLLLDNIYDKYSSEKEYLYKISDNIYRTKSYYDNFSHIYKSLSKIDLIEGIVLKRKNSGLQIGLTENNNHQSQIKFRKPTKNYQF